MVPLRGAARLPYLAIKPKLLQFGTVAIGSLSELPCRLANESDKLSLRYRVTQTASFHSKPAHGELVCGFANTLQQDASSRSLADDLLDAHL